MFTDGDHDPSAHSRWDCLYSPLPHYQLFYPRYLYSGCAYIFPIVRIFVFPECRHLLRCFPKAEEADQIRTDAFLAWSAFYYALYAAVAIIIPGFLQSNVDLSVMGILKGVVFYQYAFHLWYMFQLCVFILLTPMLLLVLRSKVASILLLSASAVLGFLEWELNVDVGGYERSIFQANFFGYYLLGCFLTKLPHLQEAIVKLAKKLPWAVLLVLFAGTALLESLLFDQVIPCFNNRLAVPLVFASFLLLAVKLCQREKVYDAPKFSTMVIYGVHSAVGVFLGKFIFAGLALPTLLHFAVSLLAVTIVSVAVAWILRYIKPLHWIFSGDR